MGEVYRARDSRLNRDVAIKILPSAFSNDSNRMSRFLREAQVLAALNHSHIAAIYGLEESGGALVMELVEGPTLAERINQGAIPVEEPRWSRDGRELFFATEGQVRQLMAVDVQTAPLFRAARPKALFPLNQGNWDVAPDGKRFLVEKVPVASEGSRLEVVTDWFEELKRKP